MTGDEAAITGSGQRWNARITLPGDDGAPRAVRRVVSTLLLAWGYRRQVELVELVASELVSYGVGRTDPDEVLEVEMWADQHRIGVSVADGSPGPPGQGTDDPAFRLVDRIADEWGAEDYMFGCRVWAVLDLSTQPAEASGTTGST